MLNIDNIIKEETEKYLLENLFDETRKSEKSKSEKDFDFDDFKFKKSHKSDKSSDDKTGKKSKSDKKKSDKDKNSKSKEDDNDSSEKGEKDKKKLRKKAIKAKNNQRKDFDVADDKVYNKNANDDEQDSIKKMLNNPMFNVAYIAKKIYPDHTPEGAQSQLSKKLRGVKSDSGTRYQLKDKEVRKIRHVLSSL